MNEIYGGVCAAKGFRANGVNCGIRKNKTKRDLALIVSDTPCTAAAIYTTNLVKGAPLTVTKQHLKDGRAQAVICNSGNANTCNADGIDIAEAMSRLVQQHTGIAAEDVVVASTGVIGQPLPLEPIENGMTELVNGLDGEGNQLAAEAIMTTDTHDKQYAVSFTVNGTTCRIGGMAKGSGMIHPNMATMLVFVTTDVSISSELLQQALRADADDTFHMISVDGDTSTNDMVAILANGAAGNAKICDIGSDYDAFCAALHEVTSHLCRMIAADGEGATKLIEVSVSGAKDKAAAKTVAKSVACSSLFKAAMFGADANWGRVLCAVGYAGVPVNINRVDVAFCSAKGQVTVCQNGAGVPFSEETAKEILLEDTVTVKITLGDGDGCAVAWGCDLTYDYVKINGDYRT